MTKFAYCSDLHLGFGSLILDNTENADCLILAGDIYEIADLVPKHELSHNSIDEFFKNISDQFKQIIWVPGNHEYYGSSLYHAPRLVQNYIEKLHIGNIAFANNQTILVNDIPVHCATLWTDMNNRDPIAMSACRDAMNDYEEIETRRGEMTVILRPTDTYDEHQRSLEFLKSAIQDRCVVVTHHAPLHQMNDHSNSYISYAYTSNLSEFILDRPTISHWVCGHTHVRKTIEIGSTKVLANCRGYNGYESMAKSFKLDYFEV